MKKKVVKTPAPKTKKITLDDLAEMTARGFDGVHIEIGEFRNEVNGRFNKVEVRLDDVELRLERIENRILMNHENRFDRLEDKIRILENARG